MGTEGLQLRLKNSTGLLTGLGGECGSGEGGGVFPAFLGPLSASSEHPLYIRQLSMGDPTSPSHVHSFGGTMT